jgi:tetratricopeptide (TPR) repeat protein
MSLNKTTLIRNFEIDNRKYFSDDTLFKIASTLFIDTLEHPVTQQQLDAGTITLDQIGLYCSYYTLVYFGDAAARSTIEPPKEISEKLHNIHEKIRNRHKKNVIQDVLDVIQFDLLNADISSTRHCFFLIDQNEVYVDHDLAANIEKLNRNGYRTFYSCSSTQSDHPSTRCYNKKFSYIVLKAKKRELPKRTEQETKDLMEQLRTLQDETGDHELTLDSIRIVPQDPFLTMFKEQVAELYRIKLRIDWTHDHFTIHMEPPITIEDATIRRAWDYIVTFLLDHRTEFASYLFLGDPLDVIKLGRIDMEQPDNQDLIQLYQTRLETAPADLSDLQRALLMTFLGSHYLHAENYQAALDMFTQALDLDRREQNRFAEAINLNNIGAVYAQQKDYDVAIRYFTESRGIFRQLGDTTYVTALERKLQELAINKA